MEFMPNDAKNTLPSPALKAVEVVYFTSALPSNTSVCDKSVFKTSKANFMSDFLS